LRIRQPAETKSRPWRGKNRDNLSRGLGKQLTHIVRVIASALLFIILQKTISFKDYKSRY
jgi:hypothetical protein